jgi:hypothetical protein
MDPLGGLIKIVAPIVKPTITRTCPYAHPLGHRPVPADVAGIRKEPAFIKWLDDVEKRKRLITYFVRYHKIDAWTEERISNTGPENPVQKAEFDYYDKVRMELQSECIGSKIGEDGTGSWFVTQVI